MDRDIESGEGFEKPVMPPGSQRLPVYLLLDVSGSMAGDRISALRSGYDWFIKESISNDQISSVAHVGIITYSSRAEMITNGLVKLDELPPSSSFQAEGVTRLDLAFDALLESFERDLKHPVKGGTKGDWRPLVYIFTDGEPTDDQGHLSDNWISARDSIINRPQGKAKPASFAIIGTGVDASVDKIKPIVTGPGLQFNTDLLPEEIDKYKGTIAYAFNFGGDGGASFRIAFRWLSRSLEKSVDNLIASNGVTTGVVPNSASGDIDIP